MKSIVLLAMLTLFGAANAGNFEKDEIKTKGGKNLTITFIKHGTLMLDVNGYVIHIDPLMEYADYKAMPKADLILITHDHYDHLDTTAVKVLTKEGTKIISNGEVKKQVKSAIVLKNDQDIKVNDYLTVDAVAAYNTTPDRDKFHPKGRDNGYVLTIDGTRIYIAGDTEDILEMNYIKEIDIAFIPVNQPYTMTVDQAAKVARTLYPKILYPYHYGDTPVENIKEELKDSGIDVRIRQMQ